MGELQSAHVDVGALLDVANRYDAIAEVVDGLALDRLTFDGAVAGRDHTARANVLRRAIDDVVDQMHAWARAMREIASALRASGDRYVDGDTRGAARLG